MAAPWAFAGAGGCSTPRAGSQTWLQRQWIHDPANRKRHRQERKENENAVTELLSRCVLRDKCEDGRNDERENEQRFEVRQRHGFRPCAMSKASRTIR